MIYIAFLIAILLSFLLPLNEFLKGAKKDQIRLFLVVALFVVVAVSAKILGWQEGLSILILALLLPFIFRDPAAFLASRLLSSHIVGKAGYFGLPNRKLKTISKRLASQFGFSPSEMRQGFKLREEAQNDLYTHCLSNSETKAVIDKYNITSSKFKELYERLASNGGGQWVVGHWLAASSLAYSFSLEYVAIKDREISKSADYEEWLEVVSNLHDLFLCGKPLSS